MEGAVAAEEEEEEVVEAWAFQWLPFPGQDTDELCQEFLL